MRGFTVITALVFLSVALPPAPALAQNEGGNRPTARTDAQKQEDRDIDKAYRRATRGEPESAAKVDPWGKVRPAEGDKKPK